MIDKNIWSKTDLKEFKNLILSKRKEVVAELDLSRKQADEARDNNSINAIYSSHMADASTDQEEMEKNYYWMDRDKKFIQYLNRALEMVEDGTFGICHTCGVLIGKERLEEVPHTSSCFDCKTSGS